jgi:hypothetical protein
LVELPASDVPDEVPAVPVDVPPEVVAPARLLVVLGDCVLDGLGTVVGGLLAKAVLVPPLPKPQEVQLDGDQPPQPPVD